VAGGKVPGERARAPPGSCRAAEVRAEPAAIVLQDGLCGEHDGAAVVFPYLSEVLSLRGYVLRAAAGQGVDADVGRVAGV
jgi:hypothetical protein